MVALCLTQWLSGGLKSIMGLAKTVVNIFLHRKLMQLRSPTASCLQKYRRKHAEAKQ